MFKNRYVILTILRIRAAAIDINNNLMELVQQRYNQHGKSTECSGDPLPATDSLPLSINSIHVNTVLNVLVRMLSQVAIRTKLASLEWIYLLNSNLEDEVLYLLRFMLISVKKVEPTIIFAYIIVILKFYFISILDGRSDGFITICINANSQRQIK